MSARLKERRKINSPTISVRLHVARKNPNAAQMACKLSTPENPIDAVVKAIADDVHFNRVRGACFKQSNQTFIHLYRVEKRINLILLCMHQPHLCVQAFARSDSS